MVNVDARGRYSAHLGASTALPLEIFRTEQARWLEVSVGGTALPRTMLVAVPYALRAADAETLGGRPLSEFVLTDSGGRRVRADGTTIDGPAVDGTGVTNQLAKWVGGNALSSSVITESEANQIGIGTTDPTEGGQFESKLTIRATDNLTALGISNQAGIPRFALNVNSDGSWITYDRASGDFRPGIAQRDGRIGIAMTDPTGGGAVDSRFTVRTVDNNTGLAVLNTANQRRFALNVNAQGGWTMYDGASGVWNRGLEQRNGRVTLGANSEFSKMEVWENDSFRHAGFFQHTNFTGTAAALVGASSGSGAGVLALGQTGPGITATSFSGPAGLFQGNVSVTGVLTKGGGAFQIDHPLDPANRYLSHSFVESPDMMNVYNGNVTLDAKGEAWVTLPEWFEALNRDFRYQLTSIGGPATPYIAAKIANNRFKIAGGLPDGEVSWQVTGIRQDAWANANRIPVEHDKPAAERGFYLHPKAFDLAGDTAIPSLRLDALGGRVKRE